MERGEEQEREAFLMSLSLASVMGEGLRCQAPPLSQVLLSSSSRPTDRQEDRATRRSVSSSFRSVRNKTVFSSRRTPMTCRCTLSHLNLHLCCVSSCRPQQQSLSERPADRHRPAAVLQHRRRSRPPRHPETPVWHPRWKRRHVSVSENQSEQVSPLRFVWWLHVFVSPSRPLHLAIIHHQTGVIQQLIHTLLSSQQQGIINTANHLQQVSSSPSCLM